MEQSPPLAELEEDWDENDEGEYDEEEDGDDDIDAQAEEMARKLNEQLWEDMRRAATTESVSTTPMEIDPASAIHSNTSDPASTVAPGSSQKEEAVLSTIKAIMALLNHDSVAHNILASTALPSTPFGSVLDALIQTLTTGKVTKPTAIILSQTLVGLAGSEALFGSLKGRDAAQAKKEILGKRKREEEPVTIPPPQLPSKYDIVSEAVQVVTHALHTSSSINPALITSIQESLRNIFLFCVSAAARPVESGASASTASLQEISGLIQVLGVLSGIQFGLNTAHGTGQSADINAMVHPCMVPSCNKTFMQLTNLRAHENTHHFNQSQPNSASSNVTATYDRPFPCTFPSCSASFLRNHDLKRHIKVAHEHKSFECGGCGKKFSRRDAIKRHKDASVAKSQQPSLLGRPVILCYEAEVIEIEGGVEDQDGLDDDETLPDIKRARTVAEEGGEEEEGELSEETISTTQAVIMQLHPLLRAVVAKASGTPLPLIPFPTQTVDPLSPPPPQTSSSSSEQISNPVATAVDNLTSQLESKISDDSSSSSQQVKRTPELEPGVRFPTIVPMTTKISSPSCTEDSNIIPVTPPASHTNGVPIVTGYSGLSAQQSSSQPSQPPTLASIIAHAQSQNPIPTTVTDTVGSNSAITGESNKISPSSTTPSTANIPMEPSNVEPNQDANHIPPWSFSSQLASTLAQSSSLHPQPQPQSQIHGISNYQTQLLEQAIANAAHAAQAEANLEEDGDENGDGDANGKDRAELAGASQEETAVTTSANRDVVGDRQVGGGVDSDADADGEVDMDLQNENIS
ncbi:hypothetical protein C8R41DRAFT_833468 [Lentinula lateritia]|uniref:C2H2-type domain-containing protein n=1 Tax=Lentinula lateritia TaxID=40482 RepID=A0ABQ8VF29_9AGAR|nr:hypothetical protein C8R41DRAFT_833468 [Lentinula lateritia]